MIVKTRFRTKVLHEVTNIAPVRSMIGKVSSSLEDHTVQKSENSKRVSGNASRRRKMWTKDIIYVDTVITIIVYLMTLAVRIVYSSTSSER